MDLDEATILKLRAWIGERIPEGGTEADTAFTDADLIALAEDYDWLEAIAAAGWRLKAGWVLEGDPDGLLEKSAGSEKLKFMTPGERRILFLDQADLYESLVPGDTTSGTLVLEQEPPDVFHTADLERETDISRLIGY